MNEVLAIIIIEIIFLAIIFFVLVITTKRVDVLLKSGFVNRLQQFDNLIDERADKSDKLTKEIEQKELELKRVEANIESGTKRRKSTDEGGNSVIIHNVDFEDDDVVSKYKNIKQTLSFDKTEKIKEFIAKENPVLSDECKKYKKIRSYFTYDVIYRINSFDSTTQKEIISELLTPEENEMIKEFMTQRFKISSFINKLEDKIIKLDNHVYVYTGDDKNKFEEINPVVVTIYDKNITEGIKISYKGKIYDYSI